MPVTLDNGVCGAILTGIESLVGVRGINAMMEPVGLLQALVADPEQPKDTPVQNVDAQSGHKKIVRITYRQRATADRVKDVQDCVAGTEKPTEEVTFTPTLYRQIMIRKSEASVRLLCDAASRLELIPQANRGPNTPEVRLMADFVTDIYQDMSVLRNKINLALITQYAAKKGKWQDASTSKSFNMLRTAGAAGFEGAPIQLGFTTLNQQLRRIATGLTPIIVGEGNFDLANTAIGYGCCNISGFDFGKMAQMPGYRFYRDLDVSASSGLGTNLMAAFFPGFAQFARYNEYVGSFATPFGSHVRFTIPDPIVPGLQYDARLMPAAGCEDAYDLRLSLNFDLWAAPLDLFNPGDTVPTPDIPADRLAGVNGLLTFTAAAVSA